MTDNDSNTPIAHAPEQSAAAEAAAPAGPAVHAQAADTSPAPAGGQRDEAQQGDGGDGGDDAGTADADATSGDVGTGTPGRRSRGRRRGGARNDPAAGAAPAEAGQAERSRSAAPGGKAARPQRDVHPALEKLFGLYPRMFGARFLPLKLGVYQDLLAAHPEVFKKDELKVALGLHARSTRYLESVAAGLPRHDLQAQPVEPVAPEHVHHAILEVHRRRQLRAAGKDLQPQLVAQIVAAIEASGLAPEDYALAVRTPDEAASAALDEAIAEFKRVAAKSTALVRAFEASGKSLAEFAEMYGMRYDEISDAVAKVRKLQATV